MRCGAYIIENRFDATKMASIKQSHAKFLPADWEILHVNDRSVKSIADYNRLLTSKYFWSQVPFDKVLIFQHDSELLRTGIEEFLEWDYVGAPWKFQQRGGNGGLSLRTPSVMIDIITKFPYQGMAKHGNEDIYFSNHLSSAFGKLAPREVCEKFSCEEIFCLGTLGAHAIDRYLTREQCKKIRTQYEVLLA